MKTEQNQKQGDSVVVEGGAVIVGVILGAFFTAVPMFFTWGYNALCFVARKVVALAKWAKVRFAKAKPEPKVLPTPAIFQGMDNLAPAREFNLRTLRLK